MKRSRREAPMPAAVVSHRRARDFVGGMIVPVTIDAAPNWRDAIVIRRSTNPSATRHRGRASILAGSLVADVAATSRSAASVACGRGD